MGRIEEALGWYPDASPNSGRRSRDIFRGASVQRPVEDSCCRYLTPGSFGLTHVPVAGALSSLPAAARSHFVPRTRGELAFRKQKRTWANLSKDILTDSVLPSRIAEIHIALLLFLSRFASFRSFPSSPSSFRLHLILVAGYSVSLPRGSFASVFDVHAADPLHVRGSY